MLDSLLRNIVAKSVKKVIGLTIVAEADETNYQVVLLEKTKEGDLHPITHQLFSRPELLKEWVDENAESAPILWGLEGRQVLVKVIESEEELEEDQLVNMVFPNADENDFLINAYFENQHYYCSLVRRSVFDDLLNELSAHQLNLYNGFVGPVAGLLIRTHLIEPGKDQYQFGYYKIEEKNSAIKSIKKNQEGLTDRFNSQYEIPQRALSAFSYATTFFTGSEAGLLMTESSGNTNDEYSHKRIFKPFFVGTILVLLILFLGNAYFYMDYRKENEILKEKSSSAQLLINTYQKQQRLYQQKDKIVKSLNYSNVGVAWMSDQIAQIIPTKVSLTGLIIDPVSRNKKKSSPFDQNEIHITGTSASNNAFGEFISKLSQLYIVDEISYQQYQFNKIKRKGEFLIKLKYKTE